MILPVPARDDAPAFSIGERVHVYHRVLAAPMCGSSKLPYRRQARHFASIGKPLPVFEISAELPPPGPFREGKLDLWDPSREVNLLEPPYNLVRIL